MFLFKNVFRRYISLQFIRDIFFVRVVWWNNGWENLLVFLLTSTMCMLNVWYSCSIPPCAVVSSIKSWCICFSARCCISTVTSRNKMQIDMPTECLCFRLLSYWIRLQIILLSFVILVGRAYFEDCVGKPSLSFMASDSRQEQRFNIS